MKNAAKQSYHHGDLRTALLDAALDVISDTGPQGLTIREVARRAGVSHAAPYRHFADKDELILAVVEQGFERMQAMMHEEQARAGDEAIGQFAASGLGYINFALQHPAYYRVMFSGDLLSSKGDMSLRHTGADAMQEMVDGVRRCQAEGILREGDPVMQALTIWSTIHGYVSLVNDNRIDHLLDAEHSPESARDGVLALLFQGLGTAPIRDG